MAEDKKSESHKPSDEKREEHKGGEHKHAEHKEKPATKGTPSPTSKTTGTVARSEKPTGKSDLATGAQKKTEAAEKRAEGKNVEKTSQKGTKPVTKAATKTDEVKIVDKPTEKKHVARAKANLTDEQRKALALRDTIAGRRPWFRRTQWYEYKRLSDTGWRRPRGVDSAMRRHFGYEQPVVRIGFAGPKSVRGLHASGFREVYVEVADDLKKIDAKTQAARVSGNLGTRRLREMYAAADKLGVRILNRRNLPPPPKSSVKPAAASAPAGKEKTSTAAKPAATPKGGEQ